MIQSYSNPVKIKLGRGSLRELPKLLANRTALLVTTPGMVKRGVVTRVQELCRAKPLHVTAEVTPNPTIASINRCFRQVKNYNYDVIIGLGGGSVLDTAKGVASLSGGSVDQNWLDAHLRHDREKPKVLRSNPIIAIPTTSGTGSEVTQWASVWDDVSGTKYSLSDEGLYPEWALLDSELTDLLPYETTLFTALDALSQAMEAIWNKNANPVSDVLATKAIAISISVLADDFKEKYARQEVREKLQQASLLTGLAFSNTKTALAHSISYPLTSKLKIPHGLACSFTLPQIMRINYKQDKERVGIIIQALGCSLLDAAVEALYRVFVNLGITEYLRQFIVHTSDMTTLDAEFIAPGRAENNITYVSQSDAIEILRSALSRLAIN